MHHLQSSPQFLVLLLNLGFTRRTSRRVASSAELLLLIRVGPTSAQTVYSQSEFCFLGRYLGKKGETSGAQQNQQVTKYHNNRPKLEKCQQSGLSFNIVIALIMRIVDRGSVLVTG